MPQLRTFLTSGSIPNTDQLSIGDVGVNSYDGKVYIKQQQRSQQTIIEIGGGGGVTQIIAGSNISISPISGVGQVTINASTGSSSTSGTSGTSSSGSLPNGPNYSLQYNNGGSFSGSGNFTLLNENIYENYFVIFNNFYISYKLWGR